MNIRDYKNIYMIGIGGISMSGIAEILVNWGFKVSGSDMSESAMTEKLRSNGINVKIGQVKKNITKDIDLVVYTAAIKSDNPELVEARNLGIETVERGKFLGEITKLFKDVIGVAGTHGKTTTSSMVSSAFMSANLDPSIQIGANLRCIDGNYRVGNSDYFIIEACEYCESYLNFKQRSAIVTNIDNDHLDYFKNIDGIISSFRKFADKLDNNGNLIVNNDDENTIKMANGYNKITYGINNNSNYMAKNIEYDDAGHPTYDLYIDNEYIDKISLSVTGKHNIYNSLAAIAMCRLYNIDISFIKEGLSSYTGVGRRFEFLGKCNGAFVYDDYAHHPSEIKTTLDSVKKTKHNKDYAIFQSHTYSRTIQHLKEFADVLSNFDNIIIAPIYPAREENIWNVKESDLVDLIKEKNPNVIYLDSVDKIEKHVKNIVS